MATIRKLPSKRWIAQVRKYGQQKSKTFESKVQAMAWAAETEQNLNPEGIIQGKTVGDAFTRFRDEISPTRKSHRSEFNRLNKFLRDKISSVQLLEVRTHHFDVWIEQSLKKIQTSSVNRDLNLISAVFREAIRWRWISHNPVHGIKRKRLTIPIVDVAG